MTVCDLKVGQKGIIDNIYGNEKLVKRLLALGCISNTEIEVKKIAPLGDPIVVRFNSGAQAGHTVVTPDGNRHVFGHFGSGTFNNTPTFLSKYFVVNPLSFLKELNELMKIGLNPQIYVDDECLITTPYDMIINQIVEIFRGKNK